MLHWGLGWGYRHFVEKVYNPEECQTTQVMDLLEDGPATSTDVSLELGISLRQSSAVLSRLFANKRLTRTKFGRDREAGSPAFLYSLPNYKN